MRGIMKKFKMLFVAIILISVLALSTMLCACDKDNGDIPDDTTQLKPIVGQEYDNVSVSIYSDGSLTLKSVDYSAIINSVEELNSLCDKDASPIFDKETKYSDGQNQKIINVLKTNDQQFFKKKSLVVLFRTKGSSGYLYDFNDYNIDGEELDITLSMMAPKEPVDYPCDMATFIYVFKFEKSELKGATQVNVQEIQNQKNFDFKYYNFAFVNNYATILKSMEDLSNFDDDYVFQNYSNSEFFETLTNSRNELMAQYDEEFFQSKSLVVIIRFRSCLGLESDIKYCDIIGNSMNVTLAQISESGRAYATAIETHLCLLEFDKTKVESVTQINVREINEVIPLKDTLPTQKIR